MNEYILGIIEEIKNTVYLIDDFSISKDIYKDEVKRFYEYIKSGFEFKELRECPIKFRFEPDGNIYTLQLRHFITNLYMWKPLIDLKFQDDIDETYIIDCTEINEKTIKKYIDDKIILPHRDVVSNKKLNIVISDLIFNLAQISNDFNIILGLTINVESFINLSNKNKRFDEILKTKINEDMQPSEIEDCIETLTNEQIEILKKEKDHCLSPMLNAKSGIKIQQLGEFSVASGLKPDLTGMTMPVPIRGNYLYGGLDTISDYFIDAYAGRKSAIMNQENMGQSGGLSKDIMLLCSNVLLSNDPKPCKTNRPIKIIIENSQQLKMLVGRYYRLQNQPSYRDIKSTDSFLIGKEIYLRSPITCTKKDGICHICYGKLSHTNIDINVGPIAAAKITEKISQKILSSKHLLTTVSDKIEFNKEFYNFFQLNGNEIYLQTDSDINFDEWEIVFINDNLITIDEMDEKEFNTFCVLFHVKNKKTNEIIECREMNGKELYVNVEILKSLKKSRNRYKSVDKEEKIIKEIDLLSIDDEEKIFSIPISNNELTRPLYNVTFLINKKEHLGCKTIDEMAQTMIQLLIESNINSMSVHGELLIAPLIRSNKNILKKPNFKNYSDEYQILTVSKALETHPSVTVSLSAHQLQRQLQKPLTFMKKSPSSVDYFFKVQ